MAKTIKELRDEILEDRQALKSGQMELKIFAEMTNAAGKIINTVRSQLEYAKLRKEKPQIDFMGCH